LSTASSNSDGGLPLGEVNYNDVIVARGYDKKPVKTLIFWGFFANNEPDET